MEISNKNRDSLQPLPLAIQSHEFFSTNGEINQYFPVTFFTGPFILMAAANSIQKIR
jgi:hypothetical protein